MQKAWGNNLPGITMAHLTILAFCVNPKSTRKIRVRPVCEDSTDALSRTLCSVFPSVLKAGDNMESITSSLKVVDVLDIKIVSYKHKRMRQKEDTNLVVVVFEVELAPGNSALMISQSQYIGEPNAMSGELVGPVPPVRRATNLPRASTMTAESPPRQNGPNLLS